MPTPKNCRRNFLKKAALASTTFVSPSLSFAAAEKVVTDGRKTDHLVFLFQGDSITDGNRGRNNDPNHLTGHGYAFSVASRVGARFPQKALTFYNRGISGNTVSDLLGRWQPDTLAFKPHVLSILIGINDSDQALQQNDAQATRKYEEGYRRLLDQTKTQLPNCLLVLCEPFIAPVGRVKAHWSDWQREVHPKQAVVARLAKEYQTAFVPLQSVFNEASGRAAADYWIWDGIHPTVAGHELITQEWLKQVGKPLPFLKAMR